METYFTRQEWFALPLPLRHRWWDETDYSRNPPPAELKAEIEGILGRTLIMREDLLPQSPEKKWARLVEECGECLKAIGKLMRFGMYAQDPRTQIKYDNMQDIFEECDHVIDAARRVQRALLDAEPMESRMADSPRFMIPKMGGSHVEFPLTRETLDFLEGKGDDK